MNFSIKLDIIKSNTNLVDEINDEYPQVTMVRAGHDRFKCVCPFHADSEPSCTIYADTNSFYCWGCHAFGDIVDWTRKIRKITIQEAIDFLLAKYKLSSDYDDVGLAIMSLERSADFVVSDDNEPLAMNYYISNACRAMSGVIGDNKENMKPVNKLITTLDRQTIKNNLGGLLKIKKIIPGLVKKVNENKLKYITDNCKQCTCCELRKQCEQVVAGCGYKKAKHMILGEAPGSDEDKKGIPFIGKAGQLLRSTLDELGIDQKNIWIDNILKCRPPGNVFPKDKNIYINCKRMWLDKTINIIKPERIMLLGENAINGFRGNCDNLIMKDVIGKIDNVEIRGNKVGVHYNYNPSYICRNGGKDSDSYDKFKNVINIFFKENGEQND